MIFGMIFMMFLKSIESRPRCFKPKNYRFGLGLFQLGVEALAIIYLLYQQEVQNISTKIVIHVYLQTLTLNYDKGKTK